MSVLDLINRYSQFWYPVKLNLSWVDATIPAENVIVNYIRSYTSLTPVKALAIRYLRRPGIESVSQVNRIAYTT